MSHASRLLRIVWTGAAAVALTSSVTLWGATQQARCTFRNLPLVVPSSESVIPQDLDRDGTIVGTIEEESGGFIGFILPAGGKLKTYRAPNASNTAITRRSNGVNVGYYTTVSSFSADGFISTNATFQSVRVPGSTGTWLYGINKSGTIVGSYTEGPHGHEHAVQMKHGVFQTIDPPGATWAEARAINDEGTVVGTYSTLNGAGRLKGFTYRAGVFRSFKFPGADSTQLIDINNNAVIIGVGSKDDTDVEFMYEHSTFQTLMDGGYTVFASALDDVHETIVGQAGGKPVIGSCR